MADYIGHPFNTGFQYGTESTYGTEVATTTAIGKVRSWTPVLNNSIQESRGTGEGRNTGLALWGVFDTGGSLVYEAHDFAFLKYFVGPMTGSGTSGTPYVLTESSIIDTGSAINFFSFEAGDEEATTDDVMTYVGCVGNDFNLAWAIGQPLIVTTNLVAKTLIASSTATAYTATSTPPWMFQQTSFKYGTTPSVVNKIQSMTISMSNNLFTYRDASRFISKPEPGLRNYAWTITAIVDQAQKAAFELSFYGAATTPTTGVTSAEYTADEELHMLFAEGTNATQRQAEIKLDQCWITSLGKPVSLGSELTLLTVTGGAKSSLSNAFVTWWTN